MVLAWENLRRFLWCWSSFCCCCCYSSFVDLFHSHFLFNIIPHPSVDYRQVFKTHFVLSAQPRVICDTFIFQPFRYFPLFWALRFWVCIFYPQTFFTLCSFPTFLAHSQHFGTTCFYQDFTGSRQLISWKLQGFIVILETGTRPICLYDLQ